jgi:hypothetical protein
LNAEDAEIGAQRAQRKIKAKSFATEAQREASEEES